MIAPDLLGPEGYAECNGKDKLLPVGSSILTRFGGGCWTSSSSKAGGSQVGDDSIPLGDIILEVVRPGVTEFDGAPTGPPCCAASELACNLC